MNYLSPTSINMFYKDQEEFYMNYICPEKIPRPPQTAPMAAGSSFDAFVKSYLHEKIYGKNHPNAVIFDLYTLLRAQVEEQHLHQSYKVGKYLFNEYQKSGALADLMLELQSSISEPRFELEVKGVIDGYREGITKDIKGVVFLGKPDLFYINKYGAHVILDWKVNGFYGKYNTSPMTGYVRLRSPGQINPNNFRLESHHKDCIPISHKGMIINAAKYLEQLNSDWADQLCIYALLCGVELGGDFIVAIDQICCNGIKRIINDLGDFPEIRIAEHRLRIHPEYQYKVLAKAQTVWEVVHSDHFFRDVDIEQSKKKCQYLDDMARKMNQPGNDMDKWLFKSSRL